MKKNGFNAIELFCGAGGTSFGFQEAGFDIRLGIDLDQVALSTFATNHPGAVTLEKNMEDVTANDVHIATGLKEIDLLIGGPSCQGYSTHGKRLADDPRNVQYRHYLRIVRETAPKWIMFENVRGMLVSNKGRFFEDFAKELRCIGYSVLGMMVNAADYGVPQRRERVLVLGNRVGASLSFPRPTHCDPRCPVCSRPDRSNRLRSTMRRQDCPQCAGTGWMPATARPLPGWTTLREAIGDLPTLPNLGGDNDFVEYRAVAGSLYQKKMRDGSAGYDMHRASPLSSYASSIVAKIPPGMGIRAIPEDELPERFRVMRKVSNGNYRRDCTTLYYRLAWDMPSYTITCYYRNVSSGAFTHPDVDRALTTREAARLQSFPDRFRFSRANAPRQIGNAVPPVLAEVMAMHLSRLMSGKKAAGLTAGTNLLTSDAQDRQASLF